MKKESLSILTLLLFFLPITLEAQIDSTLRSELKSALSIDWDSLSKTEPWKATEDWSAVSNVSLSSDAIPEDAIILFSGKSLKAWQNPQLPASINMEQKELIARLMKSKYETKQSNWEIIDSTMQIGKSRQSIESKQSFGSVQLHLEWLIQVDDSVSSQDYGNSGVLFMGLYEVQILNSFDNITYSNGQAGAIYKQSPPLVNVSKAPNSWQTYDIIFTAPEFGENDALISPAYLTVLHNGVLIQNNIELKGPTVWIGESYYVPHADKLPILLQNNRSVVRFRNIWIRDL